MKFNWLILIFLMSIKVVAQIQFESDMKRVLVDNKAIGNYIYEENIF